ncbi:MAG: tRNA (adenosine(37)-N6)-threonylcarbamoyltransferase complex ATPase subunit type 1 TsaE [SAR86 cluster bacterium]|uniref:tRNA threonylcarbamoyladenosine biosynthesis protein TsaE n=1 Tax=SAR86 cluster bacterium TaxID=2030880 RepID=A0A937M2L2_9GAMM|nr:tRNA (adenosine(37)-N6)-threonylcarbamoyltransferase complex ATPase subunit type 1 TsaE [SAR86 cluster bacterium]
MENYILKDESETLNFGSNIAALIKESNDSIFEFHLQGNLGAGKTTLVRGVLRALGWGGSVKSPTYTICEEYDFEEFLILHIDLYRTEIEEDIEMLELNRDFDGKKVIFIEWPEKVEGKRMSNLKINMMHYQNSRKIEMIGDTILIEKLMKEDK